MSESGGYKIYVELDFSHFNRQVKQIQDMFANAQKRMQTAMPQGATAQAGTISRTVASGGQQMQMLQKQTSTFDKMKENMGGIFKNTFALIGIGTGIAAITKLMIDSSGILKSTFGLLQTNIMLLLRPIGDFIGLILRPVMIMILQKFIVPYYQYMRPLVEKYGNIIGQGLADFLSDPLKHLHGLFVNAWVLNWPGSPQTEPSTTTPSGGAGGGGSGQTIFHTIDRMEEQFEESKEQTEAIKQANKQIRQRYEEFMASATGTAQQGRNTAQVTLNENLKINDSMKGAAGQASMAEGSTVGIAASFAGAAAVAYEMWKNLQQIAARVSAVGIPILSNIYNEAVGNILPPAYASSGGRSVGSGSKSVSIAGASSGSKDLARSLLSSSTRYSVKLASGGIIPEHVVGLGVESGKPYEFGERGPEVVHRAGGAFRMPSAPTQVNVGPIYVSKEVDIQKVIDAVKKAFLGSNNRISIV